MTRPQWIALLLLLVAACSRPTAAREVSLHSEPLQASCQSSSECAHNSDGCIYCYHGVCSCDLPAEPMPVPDAGIDAASPNPSP
jgi:hypothetical protein